MRFDLTVPLARFVAQHVSELGTPFKRYHIATVWRGENTQRGRYREFMQCDFDTIGTRSVAADIETALVIHDLMRAIGFDGFTIRMNNRMVLNGLLEKLGLADKRDRRAAGAGQAGQNRSGKGGRRDDGGRRRDGRASGGRAAAFRADTARTTRSSSSSNRWSPAARLGQEGVARLAQILDGVRGGRRRRPSRWRWIVSIARGLDYYTGTVFETFLDALPTIGSVCSGGRYDNLAGLYTKQELPGIGASLGLDRLLAAMEELGMVGKVRTPADVFVAFFDANRLERLFAPGRPGARARASAWRSSRTQRRSASSSSMPTSAASASR